MFFQGFLGWWKEPVGRLKAPQKPIAHFSHPLRLTEFSKW